MQLALDVLRGLRDERLIRITPHPSRPLSIANYTEKVQFDKLWDTHEYLKMCRGIIFDIDGYVWSRPFPKFFNMGEHQGPLPTGPFEVSEKMDGSLGILYGRGDWAIATRGSFVSDQALIATEILHEKYADLFDQFEEDKTYLFEILYPENRIVVNYGDQRDLVLLAVIDNETGRDVNSVKYEMMGFPCATKFTNIRDLEHLAKAEKDGTTPNFEGYVIRWLDDDYRLKVKMATYLRLHKLMTGVTARRVWEVLAAAGLPNNDVLQEYLEDVPDEFAAWVRETADQLKQEYIKVDDAAYRIFTSIIKACGSAWPDRKSFAEKAVRFSCRDILFRIYDGKEWSDLIWKRIKPAAETPFRGVENADQQTTAGG